MVNLTQEGKIIKKKLFKMELTLSKDRKLNNYLNINNVTNLIQDIAFNMIVQIPRLKTQIHFKKMLDRNLF